MRRILLAVFAAAALASPAAAEQPLLHQAGPLPTRGITVTGTAASAASVGFGAQQLTFVLKSLGEQMEKVTQFALAA